MPRKSDACVRLYWVIDWRKIAAFQKLVTVFETKLRPVLKIFNDVVGTVLRIFKSDCQPDSEKKKACWQRFFEKIYWMKSQKKIFYGKSEKVFTKIFFSVMMKYSNKCLSFLKLNIHSSGTNLW